jgi:hypothetical protein
MKMDRQLRNAIINQDVDRVEQLIQLGVDINARDRHGRTLLHLAVMQRNHMNSNVILNILLDDEELRTLVRDRTGRFAVNYFVDPIQGWQERRIITTIYYRMTREFRELNFRWLQQHWFRSRLIELT